MARRRSRPTSVGDSVAVLKGQLERRFMCGICGIALSSQSARRLERPVLERMRNVLRHRGPDDCGLFLDERVGLGHQRLSIVDVAGGHQPMLSEDGTQCIVYNGEVYNHPMLRAELEARGHRYRTRCDTETVLRLYSLHGSKTPHFLRGMFAFAIWDRERRELFLARDRFGVKPLYYVLSPDGSLYFASEIKALLAANAVTPQLNAAVLPDYLANHAPSGTDTLFAGVRRLPAGSSLCWRDGAVHIDQYWDLRFAFDLAEGAPRPERDLVAEFGSRFREAVELRLMADVPLGVFLSGGIDSAAIAATMSGLVEAPVRTFSVAFAEREANELAYARLVAERFHTDHHEVVVSPTDFFSLLGRLVWQEDEPIAHPSSVPLYFVSRLASEHVKVVLTGEGSDELLAGYAKYAKTVLNITLGRAYRKAAPASVRRRVERLVDAMARRGDFGRKLARTFLRVPPDIENIYFDNFSVFSREAQRRLFTRETRERMRDADPYRVPLELMNGSDASALLDRLLAADMRTY